MQLGFSSLESKMDPLEVDSAAYETSSEPAGSVFQVNPIVFSRKMYFPIAMII
jgi:hypothetical protein